MLAPPSSSLPTLNQIQHAKHHGCQKSPRKARASHPVTKVSWHLAATPCYNAVQLTLYWGCLKAA